MNTKLVIRKLMRTALAASIVLLSGVAVAASVSVNLTAQRMSTALPDGATVPMWGYCTTGSASCPASPATVGIWAPGPTIVVPFETALGAVNSLTINLTNNLPTPTSLVILGQLGGGLGTPVKSAFPQHAGQTTTTWPGNAGPADGTAPFTPPAQGQRATSFATEVAPSATATTLTWANLKPGTYIYETGTLPSVQAPMGLYGVLIVTTAPTATAVGQAYPTVAYDADTSLLFSEIDPVQNKAVDAAALANADFKKRLDRKSVV